jgi:hypothetical protein
MSWKDDVADLTANTKGMKNAIEQMSTYIKSLQEEVRQIKEAPKGVEVRLDTLERSTDTICKYLKDIVGTLRPKATEPLAHPIQLSPDLLSEGVSVWMQEWMNCVNRAFERNGYEEAKREIQNQLENTGVQYAIIGFADRNEYQKNNAYATFSEYEFGSCLLVMPPDTPEGGCAAFPYPRGDAWLTREREVLGKLYIIHGTEAAAPCVIVEKPAILRCSGEHVRENGEKAAEYQIESQGVFRIIT